MEEIETEDFEESNQRWLTILLIIGNIVIWSIILLFISIAKVDAASLDYDNTSNYIHKTNGTAEWIQFPRASEYNLNTLNTYDQVNLQWTNYQGGVANGVARFEINSISLLSLTCNQLYDSIRIQENGNTIQVPLQRLSCIRDTNSNYVLVEVGFVTSLLGTNSYFEVQFRNNIQLASKVRAFGVMTVNAIDPATNTDIQDQTNALINNNNSNTQIIKNAVENSTTNIINQMQDNLNLCENYNFISNPNNWPIRADNSIISNSSGNILTNNNLTGWAVTDYIRIDKNKIYTVINSDNADAYWCKYNENKEVISCTRFNGSNITITGADYFSISIRKNNPNGITSFNDKYCQDRTQAEIDVFKDLWETTAWIHENPDDTDFEDYEDAENDLFGLVDDADLNNIDIQIDTTGNSVIWDLFDRVVHAHTLLFGLLITALSIGIIKLVLNR